MLWLACWPRTSSRSKDLSTTQLHCSTTSVTGGRQSLNEVGAGCCTNHVVRQHSLRMMMLMTAAALYYSIYFFLRRIPKGLAAPSWLSHQLEMSSVKRVAERRCLKSSSSMWRAGPLYSSTRSADWICAAGDKRHLERSAAVCLLESPNDLPRLPKGWCKPLKRRRTPTLKLWNFRKPP